MQKYKKLIWVIALLILVLPSCRKAEQQSPTNLVLQVVDGYGNPQVNATVTLYQTQYDYNNFTNVYATMNTDINGNAIFNNINAISYFYDVSRNSDCLTNSFSTNATTALSSGVTNNYQVTVDEIGYITFTNNSQSGSSYQISINGTYYQTLNAGYVIKNVAEPVGSYTIQVNQVGGSNVETFNATVTPCGTANVVFP